MIKYCNRWSKINKHNIYSSVFENELLVIFKILNKSREKLNKAEKMI